MQPRVSDVAVGRWRGILAAFGVDEKFLSGKHGPCPVCGGKDRFRFDDKAGRGTYYCTQCGPGDGMALVQAIHGWDFKQAAQEVERIAGVTPSAPMKKERTEEENRALRRKLWQQSSPATMADPVGLYLSRRLGVEQMPEALRYHPSLTYWNDGSKTVLPGMLAIVSDADGKPCTMHRTYLTVDGKKAPVEKPRMLLPGDFPDGAAIRIAPVAACIGIAEGIETAIAATLLTGVGCWSAVSAGGVAKWLPPEGVSEVVIFADNDANYAGQSAAYALASRLAQRGLRVEVSFPPTVGDDWADVRQRAITSAIERETEPA
jgi:putative DNA primase/helicase